MWFVTRLFSSEMTPVKGVLIFSDGNRVTGHLTESGVFESDRFGVIPYSDREAHFEPERSVPAGDTPTVLKERVAAESKVLSDLPLPGKRRWLDPWRINLAGFFDKTLEDGVRRHEYNASLRIERPHDGKDQWQSEAHYEFVRKDGKIDKRRATLQGDWRHDLSARWFTLYRPYGEYDGSNLNHELAAVFGRSRLNYLLTQQQAGVGIRLINRAGFKSMVAANWSWFYVRIFHLGDGDIDAPSVMIENEVTLPFGFEFKQTGQVYYNRDTDAPGWENRMDLTKRFGEYLHLTLRHEYRRDYPAVNSNPIDRIRLLFGVNN
ncbi:MAG TPA: DUF481 domain-containing protein [Opitutaceae bacterium]|nr:DUF481 domain-containing protein [Opitutaceae bacterium]